MSDDLPAWLHPLAQAAPRLTAADLSAQRVPLEGGVASAVLVLFGEGPRGPDLLFIERSGASRQHPGQVAFPGGRADPGDGGTVGTALREAAEETGLDPDGVQVIAALPSLWLGVSGFEVTPVLAWWRAPSAVAVVDPAEVAAVARLPIAGLVDPSHRFRVRHRSGYVGPAFDVDGLLVWGFTGGLLDRLLDIGGLAVAWNRDDVRPLPASG